MTDMETREFLDYMNRIACSLEDIRFRINNIDDKMPYGNTTYFESGDIRELTAGIKHLGKSLEKSLYIFDPNEEDEDEHKN